MSGVDGPKVIPLFNGMESLGMILLRADFPRFEGIMMGLAVPGLEWREYGTTKEQIRSLAHRLLAAIGE